MRRLRVPCPRPKARGTEAGNSASGPASTRPARRSPGLPEQAMTIRHSALPACLPSHRATRAGGRHARSSSPPRNGRPIATAPPASRSCRSQENGFERAVKCRKRTTRSAAWPCSNASPPSVSGASETEGNPSRSASFPAPGRARGQNGRSLRACQRPQERQSAKRRSARCLQRECAAGIPVRIHKRGAPQGLNAHTGRADPSFQ